MPAPVIMSKTLLIGPAGCGKTHRLLADFDETLRLSKHPLAEDFFFILPSAEHTDRIIHLILQRGHKGFFHRRVTTLSRLITEVFRVEQERVASNVTRFIFLREILERHTFEYFHSMQKSPGLLQLLSNFIAELREAMISPLQFRSQMDQLKKLEPDLATKYEALASVYEAYDEKLRSENLIDRHDLFRLFREKKERGEFRHLRFKKIWIDGFFDFSNLQLEYLKELAELTDEMTISLTQDSARDRRGVFEMVSQTEKILTEMGFKPRFLKPISHRTKEPALIHLERNIFKMVPGTFEPNDQKVPGTICESVSIFEAIGMQGEIEMIAREIERLYRSGEYRFSDFALLLRNVGPYENVIRSVFGRYDLPLELHERERLDFSPMIHAVVTLLKIFYDGWKRTDLIHFLKSCYVVHLGTAAKDYEWAGELEYRAHREGVLRGREDWVKPWAGYENNRGLREFNEEKKQNLAALCALEDAFLKAKEFPEFKKLLTEAIRRTFGIFQVHDSMADSVRRDAASARRLEAILEEMRASFSRSKAEITFRSFAEHFFRLTELDLYSMHQRDKNRVQVYSVSLARQKEYRVVFVVGLLEKSFPVQIKEDPIFSDWERRLVTSHSSHPLRERLPRQSLERYLFYLAVTRASDRLILTCPRLDLEGKESLPSFYLEEVRGIFPAGLREEKQDLSRPYAAVEEAVNQRELEIAVMGDAWDPAISPDKERFLFSLTSRLFREPGTRERFVRSLQENEPRLTDAAIREGDYFRATATSATRLEEYGKCPFKYFSSRVLKLKDPEEEINIKQKGTILHQVLEEYFLHRSKSQPDLFEREKARSFILTELEKALAQNPLVSEKKYQFELDREELREMLERFFDQELARLRESSFEPKYFEFSFGAGKRDDAPPLEVEGAEGKILLTGKIDRIDVDKSGRYGLVIDYKRSVQFSAEDVQFGKALQLPIYIAALEKFLKLKPVGGEFYSLKERKKRGFYHGGHAAAFDEFPAQSRKLSDKEFYETLERSMNFIRLFSHGMAHLEIPVKPRYCDPYCPYPSVCRIQKWKVPFIVDQIKEEDRKREAAAVS